jgi:hypothetical protein
MIEAFKMGGWGMYPTMLFWRQGPVRRTGLTPPPARTARAEHREGNGRRRRPGEQGALEQGQGDGGLERGGDEQLALRGAGRVDRQGGALRRRR